MRLDNPTCSKLLQHLEQEGLYDQILLIWFKQFTLYGHTD